MSTIAQFYDGYYQGSGGIETHITEICRNLNYDVLILSDSIDKSLEHPQLPSNIRIKRFEPKNYALKQSRSIIQKKIFFPYRFISDVMRINKKHAYLRKNQFDLVHFHGHGIGEAIMRFSSLSKSSYLLHKYLDYSYVQPKLLTVHGLSSLLTDNAQIKEIETSFISQFENLICVDSVLYDYLREEIDPMNLWYIPNSIDTELFRYEPISIEKKLKVGFVGRLEKSRGISLLIDLINNLPSFVELYVVGAGNFRDLQKFRSQVDVSKIHFYENVNYADMSDYIRMFHVLLNPVIAQGISRVTLEAMSCGRVVVMLDHGNRYPVINDETGFLINNDVEELTGILRFLYENEDVVKQISINSTQKVEKEYSSKYIVPKIESVYRKVLDNSPA
jgi:glycosyltransferase involved in cell wall biosynthesis